MPRKIPAVFSHSRLNSKTSLMKRTGLTKSEVKLAGALKRHLKTGMNLKDAVEEVKKTKSFAETTLGQTEQILKKY